MNYKIETNEEKKEPQLVPIIERRRRSWSLTSFGISIGTTLLFFVGMPFLGTYLLRPNDEYRYVLLIFVLSILLAISLVGVIFGVLAIKKGRNPYNLTGIIVNAFVSIVNLGMTIFTIYIQVNIKRL